MRCKEGKIDPVVAAAMCSYELFTLLEDGEMLFGINEGRTNGTVPRSTLAFIASLIIVVF
jgi:hypothetical protein